MNFLYIKHQLDSSVNPNGLKKSSEILPRWLPVMYSPIDKTWQVWQESKSCTGHTNLPNLIMDSNNAGEGKLSRTLKPVVKSPKVDYSSVSNSGTTPWQHPSHYWGRYCETVGCQPQTDQNHSLRPHPCLPCVTPTITTHTDTSSYEGR